MRTLIVIIAILLLVPCWSACQDSVYVARTTLEKVASKLDSFDVFKLKELEYLKYRQECFELTQHQDSIITKQDSLISNQKKEIGTFVKKETWYRKGLEVNEVYIGKLEQTSKRRRTGNQIVLIGGGVVITGLATALIISLMQ